MSDEAESKRTWSGKRSRRRRTSANVDGVSPKTKKSKKSTYTHEYRDYRDKQAILVEQCDYVSPKDFYDDIFPDADLERLGHPEDEKPNMIISYTVSSKSVDGDKKNKKRGIRNEIIFAGKEGLKKGLKCEFALCGLCTYSGRRKTARNARKLYGFAFDLDGVGKNELNTLLLGISVEKIPCPQYIVNSGHGLHLYYIFQQPVPLYPNVRLYLQDMKRELTRVIWTNETSYIKSRPDKDMRDYLGIYQNMRLVGSCSKIGKGRARSKYLVTAYRYTSVRTTLTELNRWVPDYARIPEDKDYSTWDYEGHLTLAEAKKLYPEWYYKRIVRGWKPRQYCCNRGLYDWWLNLIQTDEGARDGTRYHCVCALFAYAIKCDIDFDEVWADAINLIDIFNLRTVKPDNEFTEDDIVAASKFYKPSYSRYSVRAIEAKTHIPIQRQRRNGRSQANHLARARAVQMIDDPEGAWRNKNGAPKKDAIVKAWRAEHPDGTKAECIRATGLSKPTVLKWWDK